MAIVQFTNEQGKWQFSILKASTKPYSDYWVTQLTNAPNLSPQDLHSLDEEYSRFLGESAKDYLGFYDINIDFISSHGHTIFHQPDKGLTFQLGNQPVIAQAAGHTVICDYRKQDVALGGQGAPLVPIGDQLLFGSYDYCLNLGGFSNISFESNGRRMAYDISPCNTMLNQLAGMLGHPFDRDGLLARDGQIIEDVLSKWNNLEYYSLLPPKSLGREWYEANYYNEIKRDTSFNMQDLLATAVEHIAQQIGNILTKDGTCLLTGGGSHNVYLIERINYHSQTQIEIPEKILIDYKEALIFGLLGVLRNENDINILSSVTGANQDHCSGSIYNA
jgi:anhydro-N-acetylmuramic acid kinase